VKEYRASIVALVIGFGSLGLLIGTLLAMSAEPLAHGVIAAMFALFGGSLLSFLKRFESKDQIKTGFGVAAISIGTLIGVYSGLYITEHQLFTPQNLRVTSASMKESVPKYLRDFQMTRAETIDAQYRNNHITIQQAYDQLRQVIASPQASPSP
jgi:hypothetical protein